MHFVHIERTPLGDFYKCHAAASEAPNCQFFVMHSHVKPNTIACKWCTIDITNSEANASTCHALAARLEELKSLRHGWLDGKKGFAPDKTGLDWLTDAFQRNYPDELTPPYLYPTAEGGIQAEWSVNGWEISLEINLDQHQGQWHALNMASEQEQEKTLNLNEPADWQWMAKELQ